VRSWGVAFCSWARLCLCVRACTTTDGHALLFLYFLPRWLAASRVGHDPPLLLRLQAMYLLAGTFVQRVMGTNANH
jgi:hypothetical protein